MGLKQKNNQLFELVVLLWIFALGERFWFYLIFFRVQAITIMFTPCIITFAQMM